MYNRLKESLALAKKLGDKSAIVDFIGVIAAVDAKVFSERKKVGDGFIIEDAVVVAVLKNQIKNTKLSYDKAVKLVGHTGATDSMKNTIDLLSSMLPPKVVGDDLRLVIQSLEAKDMGSAMRMLKAQATEKGYDYDGKEASTIAKEIFV